MYLGRIVSIGMTPEGKAVAMYRVSSRSFPNREAIKKGDVVSIMPREGFEDDLKKSPYIAYNCVRLAGEYGVVSNGSQTDPIAEKISMGLAPRDALALVLLAMDYEKDDFNTPRIVAVIKQNSGEAYLGIVRKDAVIVRSFDLKPGDAYYISTYEKDTPQNENHDAAFDAANAEEACTYIIKKGVFADFELPVTSAAVIANGTSFDIATETVQMTDGEIAKLLNPEQGDAVKTINGPVLVLAGAGTGKTRVITFRIAHMIDEGIDPKNILGMTFTNKAAREMKERLASLVDPEKAQNVTLGTFHSFCGKVLRKEIKRLNYLPNFSIIDDSDQNGLIRQAAAALGYAKNEVPVPLVKNYISNMKNQLCFPKQAKKLADHDENHDKLRFSRVYAEYQNLLETQNMVDFDDMLLLVYEIFEKFPEVLKKYQGIYKYLLVDEYQDTNDVQFAIIEQLTKEHQNLCVVGDDDQSIYGWRGANIDNILNFDKKYPNVKAIKLEQNYRSTSKILKAANFVIGKNAKRHNKNLWSAQGEGENLLVIKTSDAEVEADFITDYIAQIMGDQAGRSYDDFAILYRSNHLSRQIELALRKAAIPYRMVGGQEFFKRKEIKDAVAYLKILANPKDDQSLLRVLNLPPRGLGKKVVDTLKKYKAASFQPFTKLIGEDICLKQFTSKAAKSARDFYNTLAKYRGIFSNSGDIALRVKDFLTDIGYLDGLQRIYKDHAESLKRRENVYEFISAIAEYEKKCASPVNLQDYLESYALMEENDKVEEPAENSSAVTLTTIHAAKGLEYPYILQMAMESNIFPHHRSIMEGTLDEELRLFYVSLTRAKEQLVISYSISRMDKGVERNQFPSEFIKYLPEDIVDVCTPEDLIKIMGKDDMNKGFADIMEMLNN